MKYPFLTVAWIAFLPTWASADLATLQSAGPSSGSLLSNLGAVTPSSGHTRMVDAKVTIRLTLGEGDTATAACTADFVMETEAGAPSPAGDEMVAFPVTGLSGKAVQIDDFQVEVDGHKPAVIFHHTVRFKNENTIVQGEGDRVGFAYPTLVDLAGGTRYYDGYLWTQRFTPGERSQVHATYHVALKAQDLEYRKVYSNRSNSDMVPFDAQRIGPPFKKAFFFDYILRSGATWLGPIGHETVTLQLDPPLTAEQFAETGVTTFLRQIDKYWDDDVRRGLGYARAEVDPPGVTRQKGQITFTLENKKPTDDILFEIPCGPAK